MPSHRVWTPSSSTRSNVAGRAERLKATAQYGGAEGSPKMTWVALTCIGRWLRHEPSIDGASAGAGWRCVLGNGAGANARDNSTSSGRKRRMGRSSWLAQRGSYRAGQALYNPRTAVGRL